MESQNTSFEKLRVTGFKKCGIWLITDGVLKCHLPDDAAAPNVLYAFISETIVLYVGKTVNSLKKRMYGYQNPNSSQSTNTKLHGKIKELLNQQKEVEIYALVDNGLLSYGGFHVNLAAGLEDRIIFDLNPKWNSLGLERTNSLSTPFSDPDTQAEIAILRSENIELRARLNALQNGSNDSF